jgi:DNA-binding NtrC family response regulator
LLEHFMLLAASRYGRPQPTLPQAQLRQLMTRDWPGNVRELRNVADALVLGVGPQWVSPHASSTTTSNNDTDPSLTETVDHFERSLIFDALQRHAGNVVQTAKALRIAKTTLADKIKKHGLGKHSGGDTERWG